MGLPEKSKVVLYTAPNTFEIAELDLPEIGPGDLLVKTEIAGVDGSEVHMFRGEFDWLNERTPVIFGDEVIGHVVAIGEEAAIKRGLAVGDRVCIESRWPCAEGCYSCDLGQYYLCERNTDFVGYGTRSIEIPGTLWGGYSEYVFAPIDALVYRVPEELSAEAAVLACGPLANGVSWTSAGSVKEGEHVLVIGPGPQGLSCALAAAQKGAQVTITGIESDSERLALAEKLNLGIKVHTQKSGETLDQTIDAIRALNGPVDVVIEAAGLTVAKKLALKIVRALGRVVNVSVAKPLEQEVNFQELMYRQITLYSPLSHPNYVEESFQNALKLKEAGIDISDWVTHTFSIDNAEQALRTAGYETEERPIKVALVF